MKDFLPLGSVVVLKEGKKKIMICGRFQRNVTTQQIYHYSACLYPEGIVNPKELYLFNNDDIDRVYYMGMQDPEEFEFRNHLIEDYNKSLGKGESTDE